MCCSVCTGEPSRTDELDVADHPAARHIQLQLFAEQFLFGSIRAAVLHLLSGFGRLGEWEKWEREGRGKEETRTRRRPQEEAGTRQEENKCERVAGHMRRCVESGLRTVCPIPPSVASSHARDRFSNSSWHFQSKRRRNVWGKKGSGKGGVGDETRGARCR